MNEYDFTDTEFDDDEGGESPAEGFNTLTDGTAVNQTMTQQSETHVDPDPVPEPATYKGTTDAQKKKEMFLASKGIPGPYSRSMREGKWDKYLINPKTGKSVFSEYEARQASRGGWSVPINAEGVRELAESIRNDVPEVGEELASLIMNSPQRARKAIANGKLTQSQAKRAYELMDKVYAYNKTRQWLKDAEDFSQTYPMRAEEPKTPKKETVKEEIPKGETGLVENDDGENIFTNYEYLTDSINGNRLPPKMREKAMKKVDDTLGAAMRVNSKRGIPGDIGKWDKNARRMVDNALEDLRRQATKTKSGKTAYILANRLINTKYVEARLNRFMNTNGPEYKTAINILGKARVQDLAYKTLIGRKSARTIISEFADAKPGESGHDSLLREVLNEQVAIANGASPPKKRKKRTTPIVPSDKPKEEKKEEPKPAPTPVEPPKPKTFGNMLNDNMTEVDEVLGMMSMYKNNTESFRPLWDKILTGIKRKGINIPKKLSYDSIVDLGKKTGWDIDRMSEIIEKVEV